MSYTEDELIEAIRRVLSADGDAVIVGIGDDAALVASSPHAQLLTVDMLVEGVDFDLRTSRARDIGYKAVVVNVSDIAAMAGSPRFGVVAVGFPRGTEAGFVVELAAGMREAADEHALTLVGGDLSRSERLVIAVTVTGEVAPGVAVTRAGARPGERLVVTGCLGAAAGGLAIMQAPAGEAAALGRTPWGAELVRAQVRPVARVAEAKMLARAGATAMIDISDGLAKDLGHLCSASGVGAAVTTSALPVAAGLGELAAVRPVSPLELALGGGEDFELLAAMPAEAVEGARAQLAELFGTPLTDIGEVRAGHGLVAVDAAGERPLDPVGWDHFGG